MTAPADTGSHTTLAAHRYPRWSPDGKQIAFQRFRDVAPQTIYVMSADGQHQRPILPDPPRNAPAHRFFPRYSADGERLLFYESKPLGDIDVTNLIVQRIGGRK